MSGIEVVAGVFGIISGFATALGVFRKWRKDKRERAISAQNQSLEASLGRGEIVVKNEYDAHFSRLGQRFAVGDDIGREQLSQYIITLQQTIITLMASSTDPEQLVMPNLSSILSTSDQTQTGAVNALAAQYQRMMQAAPPMQAPSLPRPPLPRTGNSFLDLITQRRPARTGNSIADMVSETFGLGTSTAGNSTRDSNSFSYVLPEWISQLVNSSVTPAAPAQLPPAQVCATSTTETIEIDPSYDLMRFGCTSCQCFVQYTRLIGFSKEFSKFVSGHAHLFDSDVAGLDHRSLFECNLCVSQNENLGELLVHLGWFHSSKAVQATYGFKALSMRAG